MSNVYRHKSMARDKYLGRITPQGKVYKARFIRNKYVGRLDVTNGRIYQARFGPDKYIGRVDLNNGKVYEARFGPDRYLGQVSKDGKFFYHNPLARDEYLGRITRMASFGHAGAAVLLLVIPDVLEEMDLMLLDEEEGNFEEKQSETQTTRT